MTFNHCSVQATMKDNTMFKHSSRREMTVWFFNSFHNLKSQQERDKVIHIYKDLLEVLPAQRWNRYLPWNGGKKNLCTFYATPSIQVLQIRVMAQIAQLILLQVGTAGFTMEYFKLPSAPCYLPLPLLPLSQPPHRELQHLFQPHCQKEHSKILSFLQTGLPFTLWKQTPCQPWTIPC